MPNTYFIPINSMNLAHYLGSGIIAPSIYIENKNVDIQDKFKNYILFCSSKFTKETNCAIEVVLNSNEELPRQISEDFYLFDMPLPISRIKSIYFKDEEQKISTNFNITSGTAFIPNHLLKVANEREIDSFQIQHTQFKPSDINWIKYLEKYNQVLGGIALMKIGRGSFQNYPTHYFSTLGNINSLFSDILKCQNINIENSFQFAFTNEGKFQEFHNAIYSELDYNTVEKYAQNDNVKLEIKNGIIQIDKIPENTQTYLLAILDSYGKGKRKQVDSFISDLVSGKFTQKRKEGLALVFGLNKGYRAFRNKYKTSNFEIDVKFKLDSKLDYYIIESVYQNVFNSLGEVQSFRYLDDWQIETNNEKIDTVNFLTYKMIDRTIIFNQKSASTIENLLDKISQKFSRLFPFFLNLKKNEFESIFKEEIEIFKNEIETELKNKFDFELNQNKIKIENLNNALLEKQKVIDSFESSTDRIQVKNKIDSGKVKSNYASNSQLGNINSVQEDATLFPEESHLTNENISRGKLEKLPMSNLKDKAKQLSISKFSKLNKTELINAILKSTL